MMEVIINLICMECDRRKNIKLKHGEEVSFDGCSHCRRPFTDINKRELAEKLAEAVDNAIIEEPDKIFEGNLRTQIQIYF